MCFCRDEPVLALCSNSEVQTLKLQKQTELLGDIMKCVCYKICCVFPDQDSRSGLCEDSCSVERALSRGWVHETEDAYQKSKVCPACRAAVKQRCDEWLWWCCAPTVGVWSQTQQRRNGKDQRVHQQAHRSSSSQPRREPDAEREAPLIPVLQRKAASVSVCLHSQAPNTS